MTRGTVKKSSKITTGCVSTQPSTSVKPSDLRNIRIMLYFLIFLLLMLFWGLGVLCKTILIMQSNLDKCGGALIMIKKILGFGTQTDV